MSKTPPLYVLTNAEIYTGDPRRPWARDAAIVNGKIAGLDGEARAWQEAPGAIVEDLNGTTIIPGLIDAHVHLMWYALSLRELELRGNSRREMRDRVAARAATTPPGAWIVGRGWDQNIWADTSFPTAPELDAVAPQHPVALTAKNAHALVANTAAMRLAGVGPGMPDPERGVLGRNADGSPNGLFFEHAMSPILDAIPQPDVAQVTEAIADAQKHLLAVGLTGVHDVDGHPAFAALQALRRKDRLRVRVVKYLRRESLEGLIAGGLRSGYGDDRLRFGGLKLFADGALGSRTAALFEPYAHEPENVGQLTLVPEELRALARRAAENGLALAIHAIGDRTNHLVVEALAAIRPLAPHLRHRVEHVQLIRPEDQVQLARSGIIASVQPIHATQDMAMADRHWGTRTVDASPWRALHEAGAHLAFGSDTPIESFDPWPGLYAAVTRRNTKGEPGPEGWHPEQRISLPEAVRAFTWGAAYAAGMEDRLGRLAPGYLADLVVLDRNIFRLPPEALLETQVVRTMVGGTWEYHSK